MNVNYNIAGLANNINHSLTAREASLRASFLHAQVCTKISGGPGSDPKWTMTMDLDLLVYVGFVTGLPLLQRDGAGSLS